MSIKDLQGVSPVKKEEPYFVVPNPVPVRDVQRAYILHVMGKSRHFAEAARVLGVDQATLYRMRQRLGVGRLPLGREKKKP